MTDLSELRELLAKATPGPWWFTGATIRATRQYDHADGSSSSAVTRITFGYDGSSEQRANDYALIVFLRNNAEALLALSSARAEAIEEAARVALQAAGVLGLARGYDDEEGQRDRWYEGGMAAARDIATAIRALSPAPSPAMDVERHKWSAGRSGFGVQCERCGVIQSGGFSLCGGVHGNYMDPCPAALSQGEGK